MRRAALVLATLWALAVPAAAAADVIDDATAALRRDPVFQAPGAELALSDARLRSLREQIGRTGDPIFVAILPGSAGSAGAVVQEVARGTGLDGTYGVVAGRSFRAGSNVLPRGTAAAESAAAFRAHGSEGLYPVLSDFVDRTAGPGVQAPSGDGGGNGGGGAAWLLVPLLLGGGAFALVGYSRRRKRRAAEQAAFAETRATAGQDVNAIADEITELDDDVERAGAPPEAKAAYLRALDHYERARGGLERARMVGELRSVAEAAADGRYEMAVARALLEGHQPPERRAPCFFDPRHGPSVEDVEYAPPAGEPRPVPVCRACAVRLADGVEPEVRTVTVRGRDEPYWAAPAGGYYGGAFGGFAPGLLGGLLVGSMFDDLPDAAAAGGGGDFGGGG